MSLNLCPHCASRMDEHLNAVTGQREIPVAGDGGICSTCLKWWILKDDGFYYPYAPTDEELKIAIDAPDEAWKR